MMKAERAVYAVYLVLILCAVLLVHPVIALPPAQDDAACLLSTPHFCLGRYVEVTAVDGQSVTGRVYAVTLAGRGFNIDGQVLITDEDDEITIIEQRSGQRRTLARHTVIALRDLGRTPPPITGPDGIDAALFVVAGALLVLVIVLIRQPRGDGEAVSDEIAASDRRSADAVRRAPDAHGVTRNEAVQFLEGEPPLPSAFGLARVPLEAVRTAGLPLDEVTYLAVGGGMGSFAWVDNLRVSGVDTGQIMAIGMTPHPYDVYRRLCHTSQVFDADRLRSDSGATPDNLWGWPGYALREAWRELQGGNVGAALGLLWQVLAETALAEPYTPRAGDVFASIDREAERIDWYAMRRAGLVECLRKTDDGRYVAVYACYDGERWSRRLTLARYVHIATGCAGPRLLPELLSYRARTGDHKRAVHAYEDHEHVYARLADAGGVVLLRGRGITAAAVLEKLAVVQAQNPAVRVLHLMRSPLPEGTHAGSALRSVFHHWTLQPYNWPKSFFGGTWQARLERADADEGRFLLAALGGVTTPPRRVFTRMVARGLREGWYQIYMGKLSHIDSENGALLVGVHDLEGEPAALFAVDYLIDATGLETEIDSNSLLVDMAQQYALARNGWGKLDVTGDFELAQMRNDGGRVFAAGVITAGGWYAPVDSFFGLQFAAQRSVDALARAGAPGVETLDSWRSLSQWLKWARGERP